MKILSLNARLWTRDTDKSSRYYWKYRMDAMRRMIRTENPDIICLQEFIFPANFYIPKGYKKVRPSFHHEIYVRKSLHAKFKSYGIFYTHAEVEGIDIYSVHGKWTDEVNSKLCKAILKSSNKKTIATGDFNMCAADMMKYGLGDPVRIRLGLEKELTFENFTNADKDEIDHVYMWNLEPKSFRVIQEGYGVDRISDHYPIICEF